MYVISIQFRQIYTSSPYKSLQLYVARHTLVKLMNLIVNLFYFINNKKICTWFYSFMTLRCKLAVNGR